MPEDERGYKWTHRGGWDWWFDQTGPRQDGVGYPPSLTAEDGAMPSEGRDDDNDYIHICDLAEFIEDLRALREAIGR